MRVEYWQSWCGLQVRILKVDSKVIMDHSGTWCGDHFRFGRLWVFMLGLYHDTDK